MSNDKRGTIESLSSAYVSSDLSVVDGKRKDADYLIAMGAVGTRMKPGASAMLNATLTHDTASMGEALRYTIAIARRLNEKRGWKFNIKNLKAVAEKAFRHRMSPTCPVCSGRKFKMMPNTPMLSATPCHACHGTGIRPYPIRHGRQIAEIVFTLEDTDRVIERAVSRKLR